MSDGNTYDVAIKIETGIPIPEKKLPMARRYPWLEMQIGDSFLFPPGKAGTAYGTARSASARYGRTFVTRKTLEGVRCWRLA